GERGGGLAAEPGSTTTLINCTLSSNYSGFGSGLSNNDSPTLPCTTTLTNCTVSGNSGGDALLNEASLLTLTSCTVSGNAGGGLYNSFFDSTLLTNSIVAGNANGDSAGNGSPSESSSLIGVDPKLAPLGDYGGPTPTMPLLLESPAIGKAGAVTALSSSGVP